MVTTTSASGTVLQQGIAPFRRNANAASRKKKTVAPSRSVPPPVPGPPSSQSAIELEDNTGQVWDGYRLAASPSGTKYVHSGRAYFDEESRRLRVAHPRSVLGKHSLENGGESPATRIRREDEEAYVLQDSQVCRSWIPLQSD